MTSKSMHRACVEHATRICTEHAPSMCVEHATRICRREEKRTEESTNEESFVTSSMNLAFSNAREKSAKTRFIDEGSDPFLRELAALAARVETRSHA